MAVSQFTIYSSGDPGSGGDAPGVMYGSAGDLIRVLDKCLVNGYTGKAAAGWTKPIANSGNIGCYKQGAGSGFHVLVNDNGANITSTYKEAWATGWETLAGVGSPVGTGTGQFPTPAQLNTSGHVVWRKSATADSTTGRAWTLFADASTFYLFILTGDSTATTYLSAMFGDIYSFRGTSDAYRCMIRGRVSENSTIADNGDFDLAYALNTTAGNATGCYAPRTWGGFGTSVQLAPVLDLALLSAVSVSSTNVLAGVCQSPNGPDNSFYLSPLRCSEILALAFRGRFRGLYHVGHPLANFNDGQTLQGSGDFAGKSFVIVKQGRSIGYIAVETSNTVETN